MALNVLVFIPSQILQAPFNRREKLVQIVRHFVDDLKIKEIGDSNRSKILDAMAKDAGYSVGLAWCAIFITACALAAGYNRFELPPLPGAARNWWLYGQNNGLLHTNPERGMVAIRVNANGTGHVGLVLRSKKVLGIRMVETFEGNTTAVRSTLDRERDGGSGQRKWRHVSFWNKSFYQLPA